MTVESHDRAVEIVVNDRAGKISLPGTAFLAVGQQRRGQFRRPRRAQPDAILAASRPRVGKGNKNRRLRTISLSSDYLASNARLEPGSEGQQRLRLDQANRLRRRESRIAILVERQHERSPGQGRTPGVAVFAANQPRSEMKSTLIRSPLFQARDGRTIQPAESAFCFTPAA